MSTLAETSESVTENIFRHFYGNHTFVEKASISSRYGFTSKSGTDYRGYPDFLKELDDYVIVVEAKALKQSQAESEIKHYMMNNNIVNKDIIGIAISGQHLNQIKTTYYYKIRDSDEIGVIEVKDKLLSLENLDKAFNHKKHGDTITDEDFILIIKELNEKFHKDNKVRNTDRSLFFSGLMIALTNTTFRNTYRNIEAPSKEEVSTVNATVLESNNLNEAVVNAISSQLSSKINNLSKKFNWRDKFSFIKNVDYSLNEYKTIIEFIEQRIYQPFANEEKQDILGKAYKVFLSRSGKAEDKNIILTPDHIKRAMVKLARLNVDDVVVDTCMGSGGFLMESMEVMTTLAKDDVEKVDNIQENQLIGMEIDSVLFALACSNMFLHGDGKSNLLYRSSLLDSDQNGKVINSSDEDLLNYVRSLKPTKSIINPPYEGDNSIDFTLQAIEYLEPNGKLVIIMPTPTLTKHVEDGRTQRLLDRAKLDYVIKMPMDLFNEQKRTVNTSIFGFTKTPHDVDDEVLFYRLKDDGYESVQHKGRVDLHNQWNDLENQLLDAVNNYREIEKVSVKKKIYKKEDDDSYSLIPSGVSIHEQSDNMVKMKTLFDFDKDIYKKDKLQSTKNDPAGEYDFITASDEWKQHTSYTHDTEALVYAVSASGSLGKSQYVNGKFIPSDLCIVLTENENSGLEINMEFYNVYLNTIREQIYDDLADGTSKLTLKEPDLKEYYIEYFPIDVQNEFCEKYVKPYKEMLREIEQHEVEMMSSIESFI